MRSACSRAHARRGALLALALLSLAAPAAAQPIDWWTVLPHGVDGEEGPEARAAEQLVLALKDRRIPVMSVHQATDAFERVSREPKEVDPTDIDLLAKDAYEAVRQVAFGNRQAATRTVAQVMARAERAMETLNRETKNARYVLDACLALVRSTLSRGAREDALAEAMRCRRVVPDVTPSELMHPPSVIGVLAEADDQLRRMQIGQLTVDSLPEAGCSVYLNGRHLGTTPFQLRRAAAGEYRVQVECSERPGRVHTVTLGTEPVQLRVDTAFDQVVRSQPALSLRYPNERAERHRLVEDALRVAADTGAHDVVLVAAADAGAIRLRRVSLGDDRVTADVRARFRDGQFEPESLEAALDALVGGRMQGRDPSLSETAALAAVLEDEVAPSEVEAPAAPPSAHNLETAPIGEASPSRAALTQRQRQLRIGLPLAVAGVGGLGAGWGLYWLARSRRATADAAPPPGTPAAMGMGDVILGLEQDYEDVRRLPAVGFAGGALLTAALPWLLPRADGVPWYAWLAGGGGAAMLGVGIWQITADGRCEAELDGTCKRREDTLPLVLVSFATALPLLAVPATFALRLPFQGQADEAARLGATPLAGGAALTLSGRF